MKKLVTVLLVVSAMFMSGNIFAQTTEKAEKSKKSKSPEIEFESLEYDYGTIYEGADGTSEFVFKNTGKEPLILSNVYTSCGCTVPTWPKEPIMPGKTSSIIVKYQTSRVGPISKIITVLSNAETLPRVELRIKGTIKPKAEAELPEKQTNPMQTTPSEK